MTQEGGDAAADQRRTLAIGGIAIALVVVAVVVALGLFRDDEVAETPSESAAPSSAAPTESGEQATTSPAASPSASATAPSLADGWTEVGTFGDDAGIETVNAVVEAPFGLLAGGVHIDARSLPNFGPLPQEGRIWLSSDDGQSWADVTPEGTFADASVLELFTLPDGAVLAVILRQLDDDPAGEYVALESTDGTSWTDAQINIDPAPFLSMAAGGQGYLAHVRLASGETQLWHATDGRTFTQTAPPIGAQMVVDMAAGPDGFVILAQDVEATNPATAFASGDGVEWFEASATDSQPVAVAPRGPDWVAVDSVPVAEGAQAPTSFSANGLDWTDAGLIPLQMFEPAADTQCGEYPWRAFGTGSIVVIPLSLSFPCSEGHVQRFGSVQGSADGSAWAALPFTTAPPNVDVEVSRGATVNGGIDVGSGTLLVGEQDYQATFWFRPSN